MKYSEFDIMAYLDERNIEYWTSGKNVTDGWVNVLCVLPGCDDGSNHLGINLESKNHSCWKCGGSGNIIELLQEYEDCTIEHAQDVLTMFRADPRGTPTTDSFNFPSSIEIPPRQAGQGILPKDCQKKFPIPHLKYLRSRGFQPKQLIKQYDLYACSYTHPTYPNKIIAPITIDGKLVSYVAADILRKFESRVKYRLCPDGKAAMPGDRIIYNYDSLGSVALVVEGVTDVWTIGPGCVGTLRTKFTDSQIELLDKKQLDEFFVLFDPDAQEQGEKLARQLTAISNRVNMIPIVGGDPAELNHRDIVRLRNYLK